MPEGRMCFARMSFGRMSSTIFITQCHPASLVTGFAVITLSVSSTQWSSASPSSHGVCHPQRGHHTECVIGFTVSSNYTDDESPALFQQP